MNESYINKIEFDEDYTSAKIHLTNGETISIFAYFKDYEELGLSINIEGTNFRNS